MPTDFTSILNTVGIAAQVIFALFSGFYVALTVSLMIWTFRDIRSRTRDIFAQLLATLLVLIFNLPGLLLYLILRPAETLAQAYERALEEEALLQDIAERQVCPGCSRRIETDYMICPWCHTRLKKACPSCGRLLHLRWNLCPYCGMSLTMAGAPASVALNPEPLSPLSPSSTLAQPRSNLVDEPLEWEGPESGDQ